MHPTHGQLSHRNSARSSRFPKSVVCIIATSVAAYDLLTRETTYHDLGDDYYDRRQTERAKRRALATLERQGYRVTIEAVA